MGAQFDIEHANFVAYLTSDKRIEAPRGVEATLCRFFMSLTDPTSLISSTKGTQDDWTKEVANLAQKSASELDWRSQRLLSTDEVGRKLEPFRPQFTGYELYALILPSGSEERDVSSFRFFTELAVTTHSAGLVLMPRTPPDGFIEFLNPFPVLRALAENPVAPPCVIFWTRLQNACILPLDDAKKLYRNEIVERLDDGLHEVDAVLRRAASKRHAKRILHLSDLHFGRREATRRRAWLKEHLAHVLPTIDRVVVTGDLFDGPNEQLREVFDEFRGDVENLTHKDLLVIPGNHDVREGGRAWWRRNRNPEYISDLRWDPVVFDDDLHIAFISFNSSETGKFARGAVGERQRLDRGTLLDKEIRRRPDVVSFLKVALVHHHPYAYPSEPTVLYERILAELLGGEERFIAFDEAEVFMRWCASRGVSLVLHGHKHVPHWVTVKINARGQEQEVTVVGCGSTTGVDEKPMCYDVVALNPETKKWSVLFYHDPKGDGSGFALQNVAVDLRPGNEQALESSVAATAPGNITRKSTRAPAPQGLAVLPVQGVNFVRLGAKNYTENETFGFTLTLNLFSDSTPLVLLGFGADYIAPDGCYCLNLGPQIRVNEQPITTAGNDLSFKEPMRITSGTAQVAYTRTARPPLMVQVPADCDYGDLRVRILVLSQNAEQTIERYFRFEVGGNLAEIEAPREPPLLSDSILIEMRAKGLITEDELARANMLHAVDRYHAIAFPRYFTQAFLQPKGGIWDITPEYRAFLEELQQRRIA